MDQQTYLLMQLDLQHAIEEVIRKHEGAAIVTKWAACIETIDAPSGEAGLWTLTNPGARMWDTMGMLNYFLQKENSKAGMPVVGLVMRPEEDDDGLEGQG